MGKPTEKERKLYMELPHIIREYICSNYTCSVFRNSAYGLGEYVTINVPKNNGLFQQFSLQDSSILDRVSHMELCYSMPVNPDIILHAMEAYGAKFLHGIIEVKDPMSTYKLPDSKDYFKFEDTIIQDNVMKKSLHIIPDEHVIEASGETGRELALDIVKKFFEYVLEYYTPSLTQMDGVINIVKNSNGENSVILSPTSTFLAGHSFKYELFVEQLGDGETRPLFIYEETPCKFINKIRLVEGVFNLYSEYNEYAVNQYSYISGGTNNQLFPNLIGTGYGYTIGNSSSNNLIATGTTNTITSTAQSFYTSVSDSAVIRLGIKNEQEKQELIKNFLDEK